MEFQMNLQELHVLHVLHGKNTVFIKFVKLGPRQAPTKQLDKHPTMGYKGLSGCFG